VPSVQVAFTTPKHVRFDRFLIDNIIQYVGYKMNQEFRKSVNKWMVKQPIEKVDLKCANPGYPGVFGRGMIGFYLNT
jgi:hypothetical protein